MLDHSIRLTTRYAQQPLFNLIGHFIKPSSIAFALHPLPALSQPRLLGPRFQPGIETVLKH